MTEKLARTQTLPITPPLRQPKQIDRKLSLRFASVRFLIVPVALPTVRFQNPVPTVLVPLVPKNLDPLQIPLKNHPKTQNPKLKK